MLEEARSLASAMMESIIARKDNDTEYPVHARKPFTVTRAVRIGLVQYDMTMFLSSFSLASMDSFGKGADATKAVAETAGKALDQTAGFRLSSAFSTSPSRQSALHPESSCREPGPRP